MADILKVYSSLTSSSTRSDVSASFQSIIDAAPLAFDASTRKELITKLLADLKVSGGSHSVLTLKDMAKGLLALKTLGKHPTGSEHISSSTNLSVLLSISTTTCNNDLEASGEALRCIANALLLVQAARDRFLEKEVNGGSICVSLLEKSTTPDQTFILSRILFLSTVSGPTFVQTLVEDKHHGRNISDIIGAKLDSLTVAILSGAVMAREAMSDLLKFTFNILLHYPKMVQTEPQTPEATIDNEPKVVGDYWSSKLDGLLSPLLKTYTSLPPTFPSPISAPLTYVIHSLITIPVTPSLAPVWFGTNKVPQPLRRSPSNSPKNASTPHTPHHATDSPSSSRSDSPTRVTSQAQLSPKPSTLDRALSVIAAGRRSLSLSSSSPNSASPTNVIQRTCDLVEVSLSHYFPDNIDPDDQEVRDRCKQESGDYTIDDILSPLLVLVSRLCLGDEASRSRVRQWLIPDDLDRTKPLESRSDTLGRCLRLLGSVYHPRAKDAVGEMLFAISDSNATTLCALVGYGNVAGFLFHKGILNAPPPPSAENSQASLTTPTGAAINPITGTTVVPPPPELDMTDEEKEREMEKLFVLFDRLEKTGAIPPSQNPMRKAVQQQAQFGGSE